MSCALSLLGVPCASDFHRHAIYISSPFGGAAAYRSAALPGIRIIRMTVSAWLSAAAKNSKSDDPNGHRFCDKKSVTQKVSKPMYSTASFLFSVRFVSDAALLRSLLCLVCRSSDSSIQVARLIAACDLAPYCQRIASAFSPGHDSPSNDRFSPHAGIPRMENNTLESQLLSESCRTLTISNA